MSSKTKARKEGVHVVNFFFQFKFTQFASKIHREIENRTRNVSAEFDEPEEETLGFLKLTNLS